MKILHNANIYTPGRQNTTALVIDRGRFIALGSDEEVLNSFSNAEQIINLGGRTIWPGLTDAHVHLRHLAESRAMVDCETQTLDECLERIETAAQALPKDAWVRGHGWNQNLWVEGFSTATQLDAVCGGRPAYLTAKSLHAAWVNSKALALAGINDQTPDPPGGIIRRDEQGRPTGILLEGEAMSLVEAVIPKSTKAELTAKIKALIPELWKLGLVGVHDFDGLDCWLALQSLYQQEGPAFRIRKNVPFDHLDTFIQTGLRTDDGDDWLHIGGVKLFSDGALGPQTGAMIDPYENTDEHGTLLLTEEEIIEIGKRAASHSLALTVHAIGDRANRVVLDAYQQLRSFEYEQRLPHFNHRIEHVQIITPEDLPRLADLDIIASVQPVHAPSDMEMADRHLGMRSKNAYAYNAILENGAILVFGSDAPVEPVNPFQGIHAAVTRRRLDGSPGVDGWHPAERLSLTAALEGFSHSPAVISNRGDRLGKIAPGYKADFLILDQNPFNIDPHQLGYLSPLATFVEGNCVYQDTSSPISLT
jgi:hypothetical protein